MNSTWTEQQQLDFDERIHMAEAGLRAAVSGPPMELVAVKRPGGGYEMRVQPCGFRVQDPAA